MTETFKYNEAQLMYMKELTFQAKVIGEHRITIPEATRNLLGIGIGDTVVVSIQKGDVKFNGS